VVSPSEVSSEVVDEDFLENAVYLPHKQLGKSRRANAGEEDRPVCTAYIRMNRAANKSYWDSTRSPAGSS
jgi:hypothetical protein